MRGAAGIVVGLVVAGGSVAWAGPGGFTFSAPPGWRVLLPDGSAADRQKAPPQLLAEADSGTFAFVAYDAEHGDDGFFENVNAVVQTGTSPPLMTPAVLDELERIVQAEVEKQKITFRALKKEIVKIAGVTAARMVGELHTGPTTSIMVNYAIPGRASHATLTFSTTVEAFPRYEAIFDAAAQATQGAVEPEHEPAARVAPVGVSNAVIIGIAAAAGALMATKLKRKKPKA